MKVSAKTKNGICRLKVEGGMTIYTALELKTQLIRPLAKAREIEVDLSEVDEIDSAGMQLLILLKRETARQNAALRLTAHSASVTDVIDTLNLAAYFGDLILLPGQAAA